MRRGSYFEKVKNVGDRKKQLTDEELAFIASLPASQISEFREIFRLVDTDGSGTIDASELRTLMASLHFDDLLLGDEYFEELIARVNSHCEEEHRNNQEFSFDDFIISIFDRPNVSYTKDDIRNAFKAIAGKKAPAGFISQQSLARALYSGRSTTASVNENITPEEILTMTGEGNRGLIDYEEIVNLMMGIETIPRYPPTQPTIGVSDTNKSEHNNHNHKRHDGDGRNHAHAKSTSKLPALKGISSKRLDPKRTKLPKIKPNKLKAL